MAGAEARTLHLIDAALLDASALAEIAAWRAPAERPNLAAVRAARLLVDGLERAERGKIGAVVVSSAASHGATEVARRVRSSLALGSASTLAVAGPDACALFTALHVARAVVRTFEDGGVLLISLGSGAAGAFLFAGEGGVACMPLPPVRARLGSRPHPGADERLYGVGLALVVERAGVRRRSIRRVASPGLSPLEATLIVREAGLGHALAGPADSRLARAATPEEALLAAAALASPETPTLVWTRAEGGHVEGCLLAPA